MRTLLLAVTAALGLSAGMASADIDIDTGVCTVTIDEFGVPGLGTIKRIDGNDVECIRGTGANRNWLNERLNTQVHYYNKTVEPLAGSGYVDANGAYWGHVVSVRNAIESLKGQAALQTHYQVSAQRLTRGFELLCDFADEMVEEGHITSSEAPSQCDNSYYTDRFIH